MVRLLICFTRGFLRRQNILVKQSGRVHAPFVPRNDHDLFANARGPGLERVLAHNISHTFFTPRLPHANMGRVGPKTLRVMSPCLQIAMYDYFTVVSLFFLKLRLNGLFQYCVAGARV